MRYTVKDLLESGQFPEMKLISGESELNREIKGARLLEVANMECFLKCTLCQGHYDFFLFRFLLYICLLCRGIKVMPLIDCFHLLL